MNTNVLMAVVAVACGVGGGLLGARLAPSCAVETPSSAPASGIAPEAAHAESIAALAVRQAALERGLDEIRLALADVAARERRAVAASSEPAAPAPERDVAAARAVASSVEATMARILAGELDWDESQAAWKEVADAGRLQELVAQLEERAQARGNDPDAQTELGKAYLQMTFRAGAGPEAGVWASKADRAFDAALAVDDHHWESRFQKAVSLSFWPPMLGKQPDAVKQFETLVAQQEASGLKSKGYAETYLFLGNMHLQMGAKDKALAAWKQGLQNFPGHAELAKKLSDVQ